MNVGTLQDWFTCHCWTEGFQASWFRTLCGHHYRWSFDTPGVSRCCVPISGQLLGTSSRIQASGQLAHSVLIVVLACLEAHRPRENPNLNEDQSKSAPGTLAAPKANM